MHTLTTYQESNAELVRAWIRDPNGRQVRRLRTQDVLLTYAPRNLDQWAQHFTPLAAAQYVYDRYVVGLPNGATIFEPAAGIGHLLWPLRHRLQAGKLHVQANEIDGECHLIGARLFPDAEWCTVYDTFRYPFGTFDVVLANPPYGITVDAPWGTPVSQYAFLQLAARSLVPDGRAVFIVPANFETVMPPRVRGDLDQFGYGEMAEEALPGEFRFTDCRVGVYVFHRCVN